MHRLPSRRPGGPAACLFLAFHLLAVPASIQAQVTRADSAAVLLRAAQAFQTEGRVEVAEAIFHYISERFGDTEAGAEAIAALSVFPAGVSTGNAIVELMVWSTTFGAWMGVAIPGAFGADSEEAYGVGLLVGAPAGFFGGRALARSRPMSRGQVRAITFGSLWGSWMGYGMMALLDWGAEEECSLDYCHTEDPSGEHVLKALVAGGLAGTLVGGVLAGRPIRSGVATSASLGAFWGTWFGVGSGVLADLEGDGLLAITLIGGNAGLVGGAAFARGWDMSRNRARLVSIAGVLGGLAGAGLDLIVQPDDEKVAIGIPLVGSIAGLAIGAGMTSEMDRPALSASAYPRGTGDASQMSGSLLRFRDGKFSLGIPSPYPTVVPVENARGFSFKPAVGLTLFDSRF